MNLSSALRRSSSVDPTLPCTCGKISRAFALNSSGHSGSHGSGHRSPSSTARLDASGRRAHHRCSGLGGPLGKMSDIEVRNAPQVRADHALGDVAREVGEVRASLEALRVEGYRFLEPALAEPMIHDAELRGTADFLQAQLERPNEPHEERILEEAEVAEHPLPSNVRSQH